MTSYTLPLVEGRYVEAVAWFSLMTLIVGSFVGPVLVGDVPSGAAMRIVVGAFFSLVVLAGAINTLIEPCEIQVLNLGTVIVLGAVKSTRLRAGEICSLKGRYEHDYNNYVWSLVLNSNTRMFTFGEFPVVMRFAGRSNSLNPKVEVRGLWPMGPP